MSEKESTFLRQLKLTLLVIGVPIVLAVAWGLIGMYFGERDMKNTIEETARNVDYIIKYYPSYDDFTGFMEHTKELYDARIEGNGKKIERLEKELDDFRNKFDIKTRGLTSDANY